MKKKYSYLEKLELISKCKDYFEKSLEKELDLIKVECPLFVKTSSGLQDALTGVEKGIKFTKDEEDYEIVHSLAKWKRSALGKYKFPLYKGILTEMRAIRKDEVVDELHSMYVEQWDWEKVIKKEDRTISYLKKIVRKIYKSIQKTSIHLGGLIELAPKVTFITSQELEDLYPDKTPKEREDEITKKYGTVFIIGIGDKLKSGIPHDLRSPDYDDWSLDGDLLIYSRVLDSAVEVTSMGIRVDDKSLLSQLEKVDAMDRIELPYHQSIIKKELPLTIGGGIGISRILLLLLGEEHIACIQASAWGEKTLSKLRMKKIL
ncbi:MAG: aspartate--ammonia ligase [Bacilli bacterium]|nr:aspartate--ammonia ligase [Bacilli bacterium]